VSDHGGRFYYAAITVIDLWERAMRAKITGMARSHRSQL